MPMRADRTSPPIPEQVPASYEMAGATVETTARLMGTVDGYLLRYVLVIPPGATRPVADSRPKSSLLEVRQHAEEGAGHMSLWDVAPEHRAAQREAFLALRAGRRDDAARILAAAGMGSVWLDELARVAGSDDPADQGLARFILDPRL
jgi:hypothetical protein